MQDVTEILKKVRRIEIVANRAVNELFAGQYKCVFRGRGMEFSEVREYESGDDVRLIDWNVTAREGRPFVKRFSEERELSVLFLVDVSASGIFGKNRSKWETAVEIAATLMFSALKNNDKIGLITFCDRIVSHFAPRKGKGNVLRLIRELLASEPIAATTNLDHVLEHISQTQRRQCVVFLLSDFLVPGIASPRETHLFSRLIHGQVRTMYEGLNREIAAVYDREDSKNRFVHRALSVCSRRHDLIALTIVDPRELEFPNVGFLRLRDAETGQIAEVDTGSAPVRAWIAKRFAEQQEQISSTLRKTGVDQMRIMTDEDFITVLRKFFLMREKRHA